MFYLTDEGWKLFNKSITFKETVQIYDTSDDAYHEKEGMISADVILSNEQLRRLNIIRNINTIDLGDVKNYVLYGSVSDKHRMDIGREVRAEETRQKLAKFIQWEELSTEEMLGLLENFKPYQIGSFYIVGDVFNYKDQLYKVLQAHTSQEEWLPYDTPALYLPIAPPTREDGAEIISEWKQPTGAHDAYNKGDKISFVGKVYESLIAGNTWSPTAYAAGWKEILN